MNLDDYITDDIKQSIIDSQQYNYEEEKKISELTDKNSQFYNFNNIQVK